MHRTTSNLLTALIAIFLFCTVLGQLYVPRVVESVQRAFPEVEPIATFSVVGAIFALMCWQGIALIGLKLVSLSRRAKLNREARPWVQGILVLLIVFLVLTVGAFILLNMMGFANPGAILILLGAGLVVTISLIVTSAALGSFRLAGPHLR